MEEEGEEARGYTEIFLRIAMNEREEEPQKSQRDGPHLFS